LLRANHEPKKWRGHQIDRGQFISSFEKLGDEIGLSRQQIRTSINKLKSTRDITSQSKAQHTVFTVINYDSYQSDNQQPNNPATIEQPSSNHEITTNKNEKNEKNEINNICAELFERFWVAGMRKVNKKKCLPLFTKIVSKKPNPEDFTEFLIRDIKERLMINQLGFDQLHPMTYLNGERWNDDKKAPSHQQPPRKLSAVDRVRQATAEREQQRKREASLREANGSAMGETERDLWSESNQPVRGDDTGGMGATVEGDYTRTDQNRA